MHVGGAWLGGAPAPSVKLTLNGTGAAVVLCCLVLSPCREDVTCSAVPAAEGCRALAEFRLPAERDEAWRCDEGHEEVKPSWALVAYPFFYIPAATLLGMALLWLALKPLYGLVASADYCHKLILNHIGTCDHPFPRVVDFMICISWMQVVASLLSMGVFVFKTYAQDVSMPVRILDGLLGLFLTFHYFIHGIKNEFNLNFLLDVGQLVDILTVPGMIYSLCHADEEGRDWLSLGFLRLVPALLAYERLHKLGALGHYSSEVVQHLVRMAFRFFAFVACFASFVLIFEILGDPLRLHGVKIVTAMGEIDYFTVAYWVIETISLVGYGDFTPKTVVSRFVTILTMISGFAVFTFELGKVLSIIEKGKRGVGSYRKTSRNHVVLVGGGIQNIDETFMTAFLEELYHKSYRNNWPDLVMMGCGTESVNKARDLLNHNLDREARQHVTCLDGSPLNDHDLKRSRCHSAKLVWIVSDTTGLVDPYTEDKENLLRALSLSVRYPATPVMLMLLMPESKSKAVSAGIPRPRCFCLNEIKSGLFWQSCRCIGLNTMLSNLMVTTDAEVHEGELLESPWLANYVDGMGHEVYGLLAAKEFMGKEFVYLVEEAYSRNRICIFAAQIDGVVVLAPLRQLQAVQEESVFFALAQDELMLHGIARRSNRVDWKAIFLASSVRKWRQEAAKQESAGEEAAVAAAQLPAFVPSVYDAPLQPEGPRAGEVRPGVQAPPEAPAASSRSAVQPVTRLQSVRPRSTSNAGGMKLTRSKTTTSYSTRTRDPWQLARGEAEADPASAASLAQGLLRESEEKAGAIRRKSSTAPFVLVLEFSGSWQEVATFVSLSRKKYLPFKTPIVVLCPAAPTSELEQTLDLRNDAALGIVWGSPHKAKDLLLAGVRECSFVVGLGQSVGHATGEIAAMLDSDVVMVYRMLERMSKSRTNMIFEFNRTSSMWLLPRDHKAHHEQEQTRGHAAGRTMLEIAYLDPRFASGRVFAPQALGSLLAHSFHTPGIVEVMQCLVIPDDGSPGEGEASGPAAKQAVLGLRKNLPWQLRLRPEFVGMTYGDLLITLIQDSVHPVLPIGIYRSFESKAVPGNRGYVWTNPPKDTVLLESDMVYIVGDPSFGQLAHTNDLMPMGPAGLTNLMAFRSARLMSR